VASARIGFIVPDSSSGRVRIQQFERALGDLDRRTLVWWPKSRLDAARSTPRALALARWADVLVVLKPRQPVRLLDALRRINSRLVVDVDDAIWEWNANSAVRFRHAVDLAALVTAGSRHLVQAVSLTGSPRKVECIRPAVDVAAYTPRRHAVGRQIAVGWIGGASSLEDFVPAARTALQKLVAEGLIELRIVCSEPLDAVPSRFVPWGVATEAGDVSSFDVGVTPMRDDPASRGRCGLKTIQYQAAGLPVIASPVGASLELVDSATGFFARSAHEWESRLRELAANAELRQRLGAAARARAEAEYDLGSNAERLRAALEDCVGPLN
jgi:glycosyltransferase involved in cell wall biosynthesis